MRITTRVVRTVLAASALALTIAPAASASSTEESRDMRGRVTCPPITHTGTYRIEIRRDGKEPTFALLVLERAAGCLSALLVTENGPSPLEITGVGDGSLTAGMRVGRKSATFTLRFTETGVTGELAHEKRKFPVVGERTS
jgi:hypothetical protein